MKRKGYLGIFNYNEFEPDVYRYKFYLNDNYLKVKKGNLADIERINIFLKDYRLLENIFLINGDLMYYYEKEWFYNGFRDDDIQSPPVSISERFNFVEDDIILIRADNEPKPARKFWYYTLRVLIFPFTNWLLFPPKLLETRSSIEKNVFAVVEKWDSLPDPDDDELYRNMSIK